MKLFSTLLISFFALIVHSQDLYHTELVSYLNDNFQLTDPVFILNNTEAANNDSSFDYGNLQVQASSVTNQGFSLVTNCVSMEGVNAWDSGFGNTSRVEVTTGDIVLVAFWAKRNSASANVFMFAENNVSYDKEYYHASPLSPDWSQYFLAFKASQDYPVGRLNVGFHFGAQAQDIDIAGLTVLNYGTSAGIDDVPNTYSSANYGGADVDAPWRALAATRIETLRKADLSIEVIDQNNLPVEGAEVRVEMKEHAFGFGSALVSCRFPGNDCFNPIYVEKVTNLDGKGHGFNVAVTENALKWDAWEEEWLGSPAETTSAIEYMHERSIEVRGHTLFWPGWDLMPNDMQANATNYDYLLDRIDERVNSMIGHPSLGEIVTDWDVLNEITIHDDLQNTFDNYANFDAGIEIYEYIFGKVKEVNPSMPIYINDYVLLSGAGSSNTVTNRYIDLLNQLYDSDIPFEGVGFQCHIGSLPTSIIKLKQVWDEFDQRYGVPLKVTEFDLNPTISDEVQAKYMDDFLTMTFSHPTMEAFLMWGFWDGNHWKDSAPLYDFDWNLKPSGEAFVNKVFDEWWTNDSGITDANGLVSFRPFKGTHDIIVTKDGQEFEAELVLTDQLEYVYVVDLMVSTDELFENQLKIYPNPTNLRNFKILLPKGEESVALKIYSAAGKLLQTQSDYRSEEDVHVDFQAGMYLVHIISGDQIFVKQLFIQ